MKPIIHRLLILALLSAPPAALAQGLLHAKQTIFLISLNAQPIDDRSP